METDLILLSLKNKLHPNNFSNMSGKMAAIIGFIVDEKWTDPDIKWLSISNEGFVTSDSDFIGVFTDFIRNIYTLIRVSDLTVDENILFFSLLHNKIDNFLDR